MRDHRTSINTDTLDPNDPAAAPAMAPPADPAIAAMTGAVTPAGTPDPTAPAGEEGEVDVGAVSPRTGLLLALGFSLAFWGAVAWLAIAWLG